MRSGERLAVFIGPPGLAVGGDDAGVGPIGLVVIRAVRGGIHLERQLPGAFGQRDIHRHRSVGAAQGPRAEDLLAGDLHAEPHRAAHAAGVRVIVNAGEGQESLRVRRQVKDDLAVGMGAEAVLELAASDLDGRLHARLAEAQRVVILAPEFDAHRRFMARRPMASKDLAGPVLHLLQLRRAGHDGVVRGIGGNVVGIEGESGRAEEQGKEQRRREGAKIETGNWPPEHGGRITGARQRRKQKSGQRRKADLGVSNDPGGAEARNPKAEIRTESRPMWRYPTGWAASSDLCFRPSGFGFRPSFGLQPSGFGFPAQGHFICGA